mgnify:CR=1 FL=1|tara:strand:- start:163 stop:495 length:333 start_codon:yes stop_codon:yes gene_type:complete
MVRKSLTQLRKENEMLLRKKNARESLQALAIKKKIEARRLKAENAALRNPGSVAAKKTAKRLAVKSSRAIFRGALAIGKHLSAVAAEQNRPAPKRKPVKRKRKTIKRRKK